MSYRLNKSDGTILVELIDGVIDTETTNLSLVGRNSVGFGEAVNENFIRLLENFASSGSPNKPIEGQLWYDTSNQVLKVFNNTVWKSAGGPAIQTNDPINPNKGELWYDEANHQLRAYNGSSWQIIGPNYSSNIPQTEVTSDTIIDNQNIRQPVLLVYVGGILQEIISNSQFAINDPKYNDLQGLSVDSNLRKMIQIGTNIVKSGYKFYGTATNAESINGVNADNFVRTDLSSIIEAGLTIKGGNGLTFSTVYNMSANSNQDFEIKNLVNNKDLLIKVRETGTELEAITVKGNGKKIGLYNTNPEEMLHIGTTLEPGNVIIEGDLTVKGQTTTVSSTEVQIEDINIELGASTNPTDNLANGGGITLKGDTDHYIKWFNGVTPKWDINDNVNIPEDKEYYINNNNILSETKLGATVINSSLQTLGDLVDLSVLGGTTLGNVIIGTNTVSTIADSGNLTLDPDGDVNVNFNRITGVPDIPAGVGASPGTAYDNDAINKTYIDELFSNVPTLSNLSSVATTGEYNDLNNAPTYNSGTDTITANFFVGDGANIENIDYANIDNATKPTTINGYGITDAFDGNYNSLTNKPTALSDFINDRNYASAGGNVSQFVNDLRYVSQGDLFVGDVKGSIVADDSSVIIDGVSGKINWSVIDNTPTTVAGYGITDAFDGDYNSLSSKPFIPLTIDQLSDVNISGTPTTNYVLKFNGAEWVPAPDLAGGGTFDGELTGSVFGDDSTLLVDGVANKIVGEVETANVTILNTLKIEGNVHEKFQLKSTATGVVDHDCLDGHIFYHTSVSSDWTANFTNLNLALSNATALTIVIDQGATAYIPTAVQIGGVAQTIVWQGGSQPTGTNNGVDVVSFTILNNSGTYIVLGQLVDFA